MARTLQRFLGYESIITTRLYAETTAATLQRSFRQITGPAAYALIASIGQQRGDDAALIAAALRLADKSKSNPRGG